MRSFFVIIIGAVTAATTIGIGHLTGTSESAAVRLAVVASVLIVLVGFFRFLRRLRE